MMPTLRFYAPRGMGCSHHFRGIIHESVLNGVEAGPGAVVDPELGVDVFDVVVRGLAGDEQLLGDLAVGHPPCEQTKHLNLAFGQTGRPLLAAPDAVAGRFEDPINRVPVEATLTHL